MHNAALVACGLARWRYQLLPVAPDLFAETVTALPGAGFRGANVTIPHKQRALELADVASERARAIGAANTIVFEDAGIVVDNTDAPGLIAALPRAVSGTTVLVLGAGGSARAAVWALSEAGAREVMVWNRDPERARVLCDELGGTPVRSAEGADLLVNCTAVGLNTNDSWFKHLPLSADDLTRYQCVVDLVYTDKETALVHAARKRSIQAVDGLDVLIGQGALSFQQFTGLAAPVEVMRAAARGAR